MPRSAIVVGAGTSGSIVTRRLVDAGWDVTLVEAGGYDTNPAIHEPSRAGELWHAAEDWDYFTVPQEHAAGRRLHLPRGKVTGGSHALNAMIWVRGAAGDFDGWERQGATGWGWTQIEPVYDAIENDLLPVTGDYPLTPIQQSIIDAAVEEGLQHNPDYNGGTLDGVSQEQVTMQGGRRVNTWMAYVRPVEDAPNLRIVADAEVHSVIVEDGIAVGVRLASPDGGSELRADEVILAAGALGSPAILLRSGIGPREELDALGIDVVRDVPAVGANLHDHLLSPVIFTTEQPVGPPQPGVSVTQTHLFWRSRDDLAEPDTQPIHFSVPMWGELEPRPGVHGPGDGFSLMAGLVTPYSRGTAADLGTGRDGSAAHRPCRARRRAGSRRARRVRAAGPADRRPARARGRLGRRRGVSRSRGVRRGCPGLGAPHRDHVPSPGRHLPDGIGSRRRRGSASARERRRGPARHRRLGDAHDHHGQHERPGRRDR